MILLNSSPIPEILRFRRRLPARLRSGGALHCVPVWVGWTDFKLYHDALIRRMGAVRFQQHSRPSSVVRSCYEPE